MRCVPYYEGAARDDADEVARRLKEAVGGAAAAAAARDGTAEDIVRSADEAVRVHQGRADDLRTRLTDADAGRVAAEARAVDAGAEARRAQSLLSEAMAELERVRDFAVGPGRYCPPRHGHHPHRHDPPSTLIS